MKLDFYPRIALTSIKSNKKLYYPYLMTCVMIVMMFYIMCYVTSSKTISQLTAGQQLQLITSLGCFVIGFFAVLFLFYTNSFLSKRRQKEFGLYQILGMSKGNIAIVLFFEYVFVLVASLVLGLFFGILLSKFAESILVRMAAGIVNYQFEKTMPYILNSSFRIFSDTENLSFSGTCSFDAVQGFLSDYQ